MAPRARECAAGRHRGDDRRAGRQTKAEQRNSHRGDSPELGSSALVRAPTGQDTHDDDRAGRDIELDHHAPIADPQPRLRSASQPAQINASRLVGKPPDRWRDCLIDDDQDLLALRAENPILTPAEPPAKLRRAC